MRILVPLDGSAFAEQALTTAQQLAVIPDAELHLLAIVQPAQPEPGLTTIPLYGGESIDPSRATEAAERAEAVTDEVAFVIEHYLEEVARRFPETVVRPAVVVGGSAAGEIEFYARSNDIDLIVMATHARTGLEGLLHSSVAAEVMRSGVAPVALVRPAA
jgi:nucleotide-binding universal stress UspA family protein